MAEEIWSKERCRRRYVQGSRIGLRALAVRAGHGKGTIEAWSSAGKWPQQRAEYQGKLQARSDEKAIEAISDKLSSEFAELALAHFRDYEGAAKWARQYFQAMNRQLDTMPEDKQREFLTAINPAHLDKMSLILDRAIKGQRIAAGLEYEDLNKAMKKVLAAGYVVTEPQEISLNGFAHNGHALHTNEGN